PTRRCLRAWFEELAPRIRAFENRVRHDDAGEGSERQTITGIPSGRVLMLSDLPDVRQTIRRLDHLSGPAMRELDGSTDRRQARCEPPVTCFCVIMLPGLVILAPENQHVTISVWLDAKVVVRIARVPPERGAGGSPLPSSPRPQTGGTRQTRTHMAGKQRTLRQKERGPRHAREADERIVRRDHDVFATHRVRPNLN